MRSVKVSISIEVDGAPIDGSPFIRRLAVDELQAFAYERAVQGAPGAGTFAALPTGELGEIQFLFLRTDRLVRLHFDGQSDTDVGGVDTNAGGLILLVDVDMDAGGATNALVNNNSGATANLSGLAGGT